MSITAVPLRSISRGSLATLGVAIGLLVAGGAGLALYGQRAFAQTPVGFMAVNGKRKGVVTTLSGLQYQVLKAGQGAHPRPDEIAIVDYEGRLIDGTVFDSSAQNGGPVPFPVSGTVPGMAEGLQLMQPNARYRFWMPPQLAYGERGTPGGPIPPNATLVFDVTLHIAAPPQAFGMGPGGMGGPGGGR